MKDLNLKVETVNDTLTVLEGKALEQKEPNKIVISGDIKTVSNFLKVRKEFGVGFQSVDAAKAIVEVDKFERTITLSLDPENHYGAKIVGKLELSNELEQFGINTTQKFTKAELVKLLKMNRLFFENKEKHTDVYQSLQKMESTVNYSSKDGSDDRGNKERSFIKNVETNVPMGFTLDIQIFKGFKKQPLSVEICLDIEEGTAKFWLESVQLNELIQSEVDEIFDAELESANGLVVIYK